ncbi:ABC transporter ATP-binding protein [Pelistega ratti]|uniref:ABC transporter ATP-binding protein n=1 Tax=Pelistega ratti TaxID=2652177 RepID=UPI001359EC0A|nr:ABC transporter ATP-binding protein [Pelistega ratti]
MKVTGILLQEVGLQYEQTVLFNGVSAHFSAGKWHSILGASGIGKSSLLKAIAGLLEKEQLIGTIQADDGNDLHHRIAWMAQDDLLLPWLTVIENVYLGYHLRQEKSDFIKAKALDLLAKVGLAAFAQRMPYQLSGGQRQRVALARTLMEEKPIVLMDEPFSALDAVTRLQLQQLFVQLLRDKTVLLITHDPLEALRLSQEVWLMQHKSPFLSSIVQLDSTTPRQLDDHKVLFWQNQLLTLMESETLLC